MLHVIMLQEAFNNVKRLPENQDGNKLRILSSIEDIIIAAGIKDPP